MTASHSSSPIRLTLAGLLVAGAFLLPAQAEEVLWNLNFDDLAPGSALEAGPFSSPSDVPQKTATDDVNTLIGAKAFGDLKKSPLVFKKATNTKYLPNFELLSQQEWTSGVVTIEWEFAIDDFTFQAVNSEGKELGMETLMTFTVYSAPGQAHYRISILGLSDQQLSLNSEGLSDANHPRGPKGVPFSLGEIMKVKMVINLKEKTLQIFANDEPYTEELTDEKFASFAGLRIGDGTSLGGNYGSTFTAGIDNLKISLK